MPMPKLVLVVFTALAGLCAALYAVTVVFEQEARGQAVVRGDIAGVVVRAESGTVRVRGAARGTPVVVRRRARWLFGAPVVRRTRDGDLLRIDASCTGTFGPCTTDLEVVVPDGVDVTAVVETGDVRARGLGGRIELRSTVGDVRGSALEPVIARARTEAGDVELRFANTPPQVVAGTETGTVQVTVPGGEEYRVDALHPRGRLVVDGVYRNDLAARRIVAESASGDVRVIGR